MTLPRGTVRTPSRIAPVPGRADPQVDGQARQVRRPAVEGGRDRLDRPVEPVADRAPASTARLLRGLVGEARHGRKERIGRLATWTATRPAAPTARWTSPQGAGTTV